MSETDFIREIAYGMGCGLLLDVNNVFVSAANPGFSAIDHLAHFPLFRVGVSRSRVRGFGRNNACAPAMCFEAQQFGEPDRTLCSKKRSKGAGTQQSMTNSHSSVSRSKESANVLHRPKSPQETCKTYSAKF
jgi:hypothetical protein